MLPRAVAVPLALLSLLAVPAAVQATTQITDDATRLLVSEAGPGADRVTVTQEGDVLTFTGEATVLEGTDLCENRAGTMNRVVDCTGFGDLLEARLGEGDDRLTVEASVLALVDLDARGGPGADVIVNRSAAFSGLRGDDGPDRLVAGATGGTLYGADSDDPDDGAADVLEGGLRTEVLRGGGGDDEVRGGGGRDVLIGGPGADVVDGGEGSDLAVFDGDAGVTVRLAGGAAAGTGGEAQGDRLSGVEDLEGSFGDDVLGGDDAPNTIEGGPGRDTISGAGGLDVLDGDGDADTIDAVDGGADRVDCGSGEADVVRFDAGADALFECPEAGRTAVPVAQPQPQVVERQVVVPGEPSAAPGAAGDVTRPRTAGTFPARVRLSALRAKGYTFTVRAGEAATIAGVLTARPRSVRFGSAAAGDLELGRVSRRAAGGTARLTVKPAKRYRGGLRKGQALRLVLTVTDARGNAATRTVRVRLT